MPMAQRFRPLHLFVSIALFAGAACSDRGSMTEPPRVVNPTGASKAISDGAHSNGNTDVFFLPPMVSNPNGAPGYGDPFDAGLASVVSFRISDQTGTTKGFPLTLSPKQVSMDVTNNFYSANWDTKAIALDTSHVYRVEVVVGNKTYAFADVRVVANGSGLKNVAGDFIGLVDGRTLPIKVRIEKGFDCLSKTSCTTKVVSGTLPDTAPPLVVSSGGAAPTSVALTGTWALNADGTPVTGPVVLTIQDVSTAVGSSGGCSQGRTTQVSQQHCMRITTDPAIVVGTPIHVGMCSANISDPRQLLLKFDVNEAPTFLQEAPPPVACLPQIGATPSSNPLVRLASAVLSGFSHVLGVKTAYGFDDGPGGIISIGDALSFIAPGFPEEMSPVPQDPPSQFAGTTLPTHDVVRLDYAHHDVRSKQVIGASVSCQALTAGGGLWSGTAFVSTPVPATDNQDGTYTCPTQQLSGAVGENQVLVTAAGLDTTVFLESDGEKSTLFGIVRFTAMGTDPLGSVVDNIGDATPTNQGLPTADLAWASAVASNGALTLSVRFAPGSFDLHHTSVSFDLDTDQNPATGQPGVAAGGTIDNTVIGGDYLVQMGSDFYGQNASLSRYTGNLNQFAFVGSFPVTYTADGIDVTIPLSAMDSTSNGLLNFKLTSQVQVSANGFTGILDVLPNVGLRAGQSVVRP